VITLNSLNTSLEKFYRRPTALPNISRPFQRHNPFLQPLLLLLLHTMRTRRLNRLILHLPRLTRRSVFWIFTARDWDHCLRWCGSMPLVGVREGEEGRVTVDWGGDKFGVGIWTGLSVSGGC
jgi:hypothetical protein